MVVTPCTRASKPLFTSVSMPAERHVQLLHQLVRRRKQGISAGAGILGFQVIIDRTLVALPEIEKHLIHVMEVVLLF